MIELLVVMVVIALLASFFFSGADFASAKSRACRIQCVNNLKAIGFAYRIWEVDHGGEYPMAVPGTNEGSMEFATGINEFRHFLVMSNELCTPKILLCPADSERQWATNFAAFGNSNISIFVGVDAKETDATMMLSGDRNITNGTPIKNGMLALTKNIPAGWTSDVHNKGGNILLADGSVQQDSINGLRVQIANTGVETNCVQMPVVGP